MRIVGEQLQVWAEDKKVEHEKDIFARSAFNRFYYASFLITRDMLGELKPEWKKTAHKNIPDLLRTSVKKAVDKELKKLFRKGVVSPGEMSALKTSLNGATSELSNLLTEAYDLRVIADYEPEVPVLTKNKVLLLRKYKLNSAREWPGKTGAFCKTIRKVWRDVGLA